MNIIYKFKNLKTWQKLGIGIALLTIFKYLTMGSIFLEVKAQEYDKPNIIILNPATGQPANIELIGADPYRTNFVSQENLNIMTTNRPYLFTPTQWVINNNNTRTEIINTSRYNIENEMQVPIRSNQNTKGYITGFEIYQEGNSNGNISNIQPIHKNTDYTFLIGFLGDGWEKGASYYGEKGNDNNFNVNIDYCYKITNQETSCQTMNGLYDYEIDYINGESGIYFNNPYLSYVKLKIHTNDLFPSGDKTYTISKISINLKNDNNISNGEVNIDNLKYFFKAKNYEDIVAFKIDTIAMIMDGEVYVEKNPGSYNFPGQLITNQGYETCDTLDLACHVRNIQRGIENFGKNILYSLKSLFNYIFIPDWDFLNEYIDETHQKLGEKYPDIQALEDYFEYFSMRLNDLSRETTISFPGVKWPFDESIQLIPAFTYDFNSIINDSRINPWYQIYRVIISALIIIAWGLWLKRWLESILHNTPSVERG